MFVRVRRVYKYVNVCLLETKSEASVTSFFGIARGRSDDCTLFLPRILSLVFQMFVLVLFWFQLYNGFSGSNAIDDLSLIFFNLIFTAVPPVICGILDKDVPDPILTAKPDLYKSGQNSKVGDFVIVCRYLCSYVRS